MSTANDVAKQIEILIAQAKERSLFIEGCNKVLYFGENLNSHAYADWVKRRESAVNSLASIMEELNFKAAFYEAIM